MYNFRPSFVHDSMSKGSNFVESIISRDDDANARNVMYILIRRGNFKVALSGDIESHQNNPNLTWLTVNHLSE